MTKASSNLFFAVQANNKFLQKITNSLSRGFVEFLVVRPNSSNTDSFYLC